MRPLKSFRISRDPVVLWNLIAVLVMGAGRIFFHFGDEHQAWVDAVSVTLANFVAAWRVHDGQLPALAGLMKAVFALVIGLGVHLSPNVQVGVMTLVLFVGGMWVRSQVAPKGEPAPVAVAQPVVVAESRGGLPLR